MLQLVGNAPKIAVTVREREKNDPTAYDTIT